jgi:hypothetical protein
MSFWDVTALQTDVSISEKTAATIFRIEESFILLTLYMLIVRFHFGTFSYPAGGTVKAHMVLKFSLHHIVGSYGWSHVCIFL